jgi:hypothetical protein
MDTIKRDDILFLIMKDEIQDEAMERYGKPLSEIELDIAQDGLEWGLLTGINVVYDAIFDMIEEHRKEEGTKK